MLNFNVLHRIKALNFVQFNGFFKKKKNRYAWLLTSAVYNQNLCLKFWVKNHLQGFNEVFQYISKSIKTFLIRNFFCSNVKTNKTTKTNKTKKLREMFIWQHIFQPANKIQVNKWSLHQITYCLTGHIHIWLTSFFIGCKILKYFNDLYIWQVSTSLQK